MSQPTDTRPGGAAAAKHALGHGVTIDHGARSGVELERLPLVTYIAPFDAAGSVEYVSHQIETMLGFAIENCVSDPMFWFDQVLPEDRETVRAASADVRGTREPVTVEYRLRARDGRVVWVRDVCMVVTADDGRATVQGFLADITREKELEIALARERAQTDAFFRDSSVGLAITDAEGRFVRVNESLARMNCMSPEEHVGLRLRDFAPEIADGVEPLLEEVWRTGKPVLGRALSVPVPAGGTTDSLVSYFPVDAAGAKQFGGIVIDVTDFNRSVSALRTSEEKFRAVFDNALDAMVVADDDGRYVDANPAACKLFGRTREELLTLSVADIAHPTGGPGAASWEAFIAEGGAAGEFTIVHSDGTLRETEGTATANVRPGHHLSILHDVTERRRLERALFQAQKLESVGTLAGGIAHDFNNMLTAISGYAQLLLARLAPGSDEREHAEEIERAAARAAKLTAQLLAFGRRQVLQPQALDLNALMTVLSTTVARTVGSAVTVEFEPDRELRLVRADPAQMEQVILNIVVNAAEAMPDGGRVAVRTRNVDVQHAVAAANGSTARELAVGCYAELSISDTGLGMDAATLEHVFEPFFTTKDVALGDGLGLSTAYGIVKQSGGAIVAESSPGSGSTFHIYLPVAEGEHPTT